jgi:PPM family protein phosphatase
VGTLIRWEGGTDVGLVRRRNEDAWVAVPLEGNRGGVILAVADGMGGQPGGDVAARLAVETVSGLGPTRGGDSDPPALLRDLFREAQSALARKARSEPSLSHMGTTLTILLVRDDGAWVGHVGDSRLAWQRENEICLVTRDHSLAWDLVEAELLSPDAAELDPSGSVLTKHLGPFAGLNPDVFERPLLLARGDRILLLTDGLGKVVPMQEVAGVVQRQTAAGAVRELIHQARAGGAPDNVTVLLAEVENPPVPTGPTFSWEESRYRWIARG